jgi:hypothetical protein
MRSLGDCEISLRPNIVPRLVSLLSSFWALNHGPTAGDPFARVLLFSTFGCVEVSHSLPSSNGNTARAAFLPLAVLHCSLS